MLPGEAISILRTGLRIASPGAGINSLIRLWKPVIYTSNRIASTGVSTKINSLR
jgi:hypothetical protein